MVALIATANDSIAVRNARDISGSEAIWPALSAFARSCNVIDDSETTLADITLSVSVSDAWAYVPRDDALKSATGLSTRSPLPTTQSRAFFNAPGTPWAYSGTENATPSAVSSLDRRSFTAGDTISPSRSGLNCGRSPSPSYRVTSTPGGAKTAAAWRRAVFEEEARRLPDIARTLMRLFHP